MDGELGHVKDFIIDDETWHLEYLVIEMHHFIVGKKVLLACSHIRELQWDMAKVLLDVMSDVLKNSQACEESGLVSLQH